MNDESDVDIEYHNKLKKLKLPNNYIDEMPKKYIDALYQIFIERQTVVVDDSDEKKMKIVMKILNKILKIANKDQIDDIKKFEISREDIIKKEIQEYFESKYVEVFKLFDKKKHRYYFRKQIDNYILSFLRSSIKEFGHKFDHYQRTYNKEVDGKKIPVVTTFYYVK